MYKLLLCNVKVWSTISQQDEYRLLSFNVLCFTTLWNISNNKQQWIISILPFLYEKMSPPYFFVLSYAKWFRLWLIFYIVVPLCYFFRSCSINFIIILIGVNFRYEFDLIGFKLRYEFLSQFEFFNAIYQIIEVKEDNRGSTIRWSKFIQHNWCKLELDNRLLHILSAATNKDWFKYFDTCSS